METIFSIPVMIFWLQLNVYHEARGEDEYGRRLVVHTVLERVQRRDRSVKEVITRKKQYSWLNSGMKGIKNPLVFMGCNKAVMNALQERLNGITHGHIDHYFNPEKANPSWQHAMTLVVQAGSHKFYRSR